MTDEARASFYAVSFQMPALLLMVLDCMRWVNSGLLVATAYLAYNLNTEPWVGIFAVIGLIFPSAYSIVALTTTLETPMRSNDQPGLPPRPVSHVASACRRP